MNNFASFVVRRRLIVILLVLALSGWFGFQAASLRSDPNPMNIFPADDPDVQFSHEAGERFGSNYINMIALQADDLFTHDALATLQAMTKAAAETPGVNNVISLANMLDMQPDGEGSISVRQLIDPAGPPTAPEELAKLRANVLGNALLVGNLVSADGTTALMSVMLDKDADSTTVGGAIKQAVSAAAPGQRIYFGGVEMIIDYLAQAIASPRMIAVMTMMFVLLIAALYWGLGSARALAVTLGVTVLTIVWTLGALAMTGVVLSMFTSMLPLLIFAVGALPTIVLLARYNTTQNAQDALAQQAPAILTAGLTMAAVFFTLVFTPLDILRDIGLGLGLTALAATLLALTFAPAVLSFFTFKEPRRFAFVSAQNGWAAKLSQSAAQRRKALALAAVVVTIAAAALTFYVPRNANMMDNFPAGSEPRATDDLMLKHFGGSSLFMINFRAKDVREPAILEQMELLSKRIRTIENVYFPQSIADVVTMLNRNLNAEPTVPESMEKINNLWFMLEGQAQVAMLLDKSFSDGIILGRIGSMDAAVVGRAIAQIRQAIDDTVHTDLVSVAPGDFPEKQRKELLKALAERAAEKAMLDYQFHTGKKIKNPKGFARALRVARTDRILLTATERAELQSRIAAYLSGSGCDVLLPENFDATPAAQALAALNAPDAPTLVAALQQALPQASWQNDPESLNYAAATIGETFDKLYKRLRLAKARKTAEKAMALDLRTAMHAALSADLDGDLWTINNNRMGLDYARYKEIVGAEPPAENRIAAEVRLTGLPVVTAKLNDRLPADTAKALGLALALIFVIALLRTRSAKTAAAISWTVMLTVLINFAALTVLGIALDNIIVVVQNIAMAVGAAYALLLAGGPDEGRAIVAHTCAVALGFAAMIFAALGTQALLGLFVTLSMITTTFAVFALVPLKK